MQPLYESICATGAASAAVAFAGPKHAPIPSEELERGELLAAEKEAIGLFISAHPLKEVGAALGAKVDCPLAQLANRRDGDWVTVGGMITQAKRIRTKKGDPMMFASLDDLEATVEIIVFGKALAAHEEALSTDSIVLARGRVDHKDQEKTCIVAQHVERFEPTAQEVQHAAEQAAKIKVAPSALRLRLDPTVLPGSILDELKELLGSFPGECDVVIELRTSAGPRRLRLGHEFRVTRSAGLHAELHALLGEAILAVPGDAAAEGPAGDPASATALTVASAPPEEASAVGAVL